MTETDYENPWTFRDKPFTSDDVGKFVGFVYIIECIPTGQKYVGKKTLTFLRKSALKKHIGRKTRVRKESDWKKYYGSSPQLLDLVEKYGKDKFIRKIISLHTTPGDVNYTEIKELFQRNALEDDQYLNDNINGKWFRKPKHIIESRLVDEGVK